MRQILIDKNMEGYRDILKNLIEKEGFSEIVQFIIFNDVGLPMNASDRTIWRKAQEKKLILLTDNRNKKGKDSLEQTICEENKQTSLPILTISNKSRFRKDQEYRKQCIFRLLEIVLYLDNYYGVGRIFIP